MNDEMEELLERVITGDLSENSEEFRAACARDARLGRRLAELRRTTTTLDAFGAAERTRVRAELGETRFNSVEREFERQVRARLLVPRSWQRTRTTAAVAAAAAIVAATYWLAHHEGGERPAEQPGSGRDRMLLGPGVHPTPNLATPPAPFEWFRWGDFELPVLGTFVLRVYGDASHSQALCEPIETTATAYRFDPLVTSQWPDEIHYTLDALDAAGVSRAHCDETARRTHH